MYGRGRLRPIFRSRWVDAEYYKLVHHSERMFVYTEKPNPYSCESCGFDSNVKTNFCPNCGKAMNDEAVELVKSRLEGVKHDELQG